MFKQNVISVVLIHWQFVTEKTVYTCIQIYCTVHRQAKLTCWIWIKDLYGLSILCDSKNSLCWYLSMPQFMDTGNWFIVYWNIYTECQSCEVQKQLLPILNIPWKINLTHSCPTGFYQYQITMKNKFNTFLSIEYSDWTSLAWPRKWNIRYIKLYMLHYCAFLLPALVKCIKKVSLNNLCVLNLCFTVYITFYSLNIGHWSTNASSWTHTYNLAKPG